MDAIIFRRRMRDLRRGEKERRERGKAVSPHDSRETWARERAKEREGLGEREERRREAEWGRKERSMNTIERERDGDEEGGRRRREIEEGEGEEEEEEEEEAREEYSCPKKRERADSHSFFSRLLASRERIFPPFAGNSCHPSTCPLNTSSTFLLLSSSLSLLSFPRLSLSLSSLSSSFVYGRKPPHPMHDRLLLLLSVAFPSEATEAVEICDVRGKRDKEEGEEEEDGVGRRERERERRWGTIDRWLREEEEEEAGGWEEEDMM
jgi:hypothetical protein